MKPENNRQRRRKRKSLTLEDSNREERKLELRSPKEGAEEARTRVWNFLEAGEEDRRGKKHREERERGREGQCR